MSTAIKPAADHTSDRRRESRASPPLKSQTSTAPCERATDSTTPSLLVALHPSPPTPARRPSQLRQATSRLPRSPQGATLGLAPVARKRTFPPDPCAAQR